MKALPVGARMPSTLPEGTEDSSTLPSGVEASKAWLSSAAQEDPFPLGRGRANPRPRPLLHPGGRVRCVRWGPPASGGRRARALAGRTSLEKAILELSTTEPDAALRREGVKAQPAGAQVSTGARMQSTQPDGAEESSTLPAGVEGSEARLNERGGQEVWER